MLAPGNGRHRQEGSPKIDRKTKVSASRKPESCTVLQFAALGMRSGEILEGTWENACVPDENGGAPVFPKSWIFHLSHV